MPLIRADAIDLSPISEEGNVSNPSSRQGSVVQGGNADNADLSPRHRPVQGGDEANADPSPEHKPLLGGDDAGPSSQHRTVQGGNDDNDDDDDEGSTSAAVNVTPRRLLLSSVDYEDVRERVRAQRRREQRRALHYFYGSTAIGVVTIIGGLAYSQSYFCASSSFRCNLISTVITAAGIVIVFFGAVFSFIQRRYNFFSFGD